MCKILQLTSVISKLLYVKETLSNYDISYYTRLYKIGQDFLDIQHELYLCVAGYEKRRFLLSCRIWGTGEVVLFKKFFIVFAEFRNVWLWCSTVVIAIIIFLSINLLPRGFLPTRFLCLIITLNYVMVSGKLLQLLIFLRKHLCFHTLIRVTKFPLAIIIENKYCYCLIKSVV